MRDIKTLIKNLSGSPDILDNLLRDIPEEVLKRRRITGKWSIHEHTAHLAEVQPMLYERLVRFKNEERPVFRPYLPGKNVPDSALIDLDLQESLIKFRKERLRLIEYLSHFEEGDWLKEGEHPEYKIYTPYIITRHILMHDHFHMYRIEEQWLTNDEYLPG